MHGISILVCTTLYVVQTRHTINVNAYYVAHTHTHTHTYMNMTYSHVLSTTYRTCSTMQVNMYTRRKCSGIRFPLFLLKTKVGLHLLPLSIVQLSQFFLPFLGSSLLTESVFMSLSSSFLLFLLDVALCVRVYMCVQCQHYHFWNVTLSMDTSLCV